MGSSWVSLDRAFIVGGLVLLVQAWVTRMLKEQPDIILFENVVGYPIHLLQESFRRTYNVLPGYLDPRMFGVPMARTRLYCLLIHKRRQWHGKACEDWVAEFAGSETETAAGTYNALTYADTKDSEGTRALTPLEEKHLKQYLENPRSDVSILDLRQSLNIRVMGNLVDGALPTLRTTCGSLYMLGTKRFLSSFQLLRAMGWPVLESDSNALELQHHPFPLDVPVPKRFVMAGNGMFAPCVALAVATALLHSS